MNIIRNILLFLAAILPTVLKAQQVDKVVFWGPGMSSALVNGTKSAAAVGGGKLVFHLGTGGWFSQLALSASFVDPISKAKPYWSMRPAATLGYRFRGGRNRFAVFGGFGETRTRTGDFLPTAIAGTIIKLKGRWGLVNDVSRSSVSWGSSATLGYRF